MKIRTLLACIFLLAAPSLVLASQESVDKKARAEVVADEIMNMWSTLAKKFLAPGVVLDEDKINEFLTTIRARSRAIYEKEGLIVRYAATRNRNPEADAKSDERRALYEFERNRQLKDKWGTIEIRGKKYVAYMRPMFIEESCLVCHGDKEKLPKWIVKSYPDDTASDYRLGDLRGLLEVLYPAE